MGRQGERGHESTVREAGSGCRGRGQAADAETLVLLVCKITAARCRLGNWVLMCPSRHPST